MPLNAPSGPTTTRRPDLDEAVGGFELSMSRQGFVSNRIVTPIDVDTKKGHFPVIPLEQYLQEFNDERTELGGYNEGHYKYLTMDYSSQAYGRQDYIDEEQEKEHENYFNAERFLAEVQVDTLARKYEMRVASAVTADYGFNTAAAEVWDDRAASDPIKDVDDAVKAFRARNGVKPNTLILPFDAFKACRRSDAIKADIASEGAGSSVKQTDVTAEVLAKVFDIQHVIVADAMKNTKDSSQAAVLADIWGRETAVLLYQDFSTEFRRPTFFRVFHWTRRPGMRPGGNPVGITAPIDTFADPKMDGRYIRTKTHYGIKTVFTRLSQRITGVLA